MWLDWTTARRRLVEDFENFVDGTQGVNQADAALDTATVHSLLAAVCDCVRQRILLGFVLIARKI